MKLVLQRITEENGSLKVSDSVYTIPHATAQHYRQLVKFDEVINYTEMSVEEYDKVVGFVCEVFRNQFTVDDFYEGIPSHKLIDTIVDVFSFVRTGKTPEEIKSLENNEGKI